jgi:phage tail sheath protein FI
MPNYVSPGVYTVEKDISDYTPSINSSVVGIVGFASKGPTNKATLITSQNSLIDTFGAPSEAITGQGLEGALEILEQTNSIYFVRAADATVAADASASLSFGTCPAILVSGVATNGERAQGWGANSPVYPLTLRIQVWDENGVAKYTNNSGAGKDFTIPAGTSVLQSLALKSVIGGELDADHVGVETGPLASTISQSTGLALSGLIYGSFAGSGASLAISACSGTSFNGADGVSALRQVYSPSSSSNYGVSGSYASAIKVWGATYTATGTNSVGYKVESLYPGAGYNGGVKTNGDTSGNSITVSKLGSQNFSINVNENGATQETFKASLVGSGAYLEDVINTGETDTTSDIIKGNIIKDDVDANAASIPTWLGTMANAVSDTLFSMTHQAYVVEGGAGDGTTTPATTVHTSDNGGIFNKLVETAAANLAGGNNGIPASPADALIGDATAEPKTGMQALDDDVLNIGIALVPGIQTQSVQNALITMAETTQNFLALVSPPVAVGTVQDAIDWTNGKSSSTAGSRSSAINSSYAAIHWPWVKVFSTFDSKDRWYDPSIFAARQMAYTDAVSDSWFAPAGFRRGRLTKPTEVEVKLNQGDRDTMYSGGNVVNPIVAFPQQGITIFGQRTAQREPTALDRINVRRLMIYIRKVIQLAAQRFVFEPNDEFTWEQIEGVLNPFLDDIKRRRGIVEFRVVCDETVNTPVRVDRNELWTKVLIKPTKTAEMLIFEINLTNQGAQLGNL